MSASVVVLPVTATPLDVVVVDTLVEAVDISLLVVGATVVVVVGRLV